jgi:DNA-binding MarR family transcriptional regulator
MDGARAMPTTDPSADTDRAFTTIERSLSHLARLARPSRIFGAVTDVHGRPIDRAAYSVLARVEEFGPIRLTDLAIAMEIDISTASRQVRALEERDLVVRADAPGDQRSSLLRLTTDGESVLARSRALRLRGIHQRLDTWNDADLCALAGLLERFAESLSGPCDPSGATDDPAGRQPPATAAHTTPGPPSTPIAPAHRASVTKEPAVS